MSKKKKNQFLIFNTNTFVYIYFHENKKKYDIFDISFVNY